MEQRTRSQEPRQNSQEDIAERNEILPITARRANYLLPSGSETYRAFPTIDEALAAAFAEASPDDLIFIGGSNYVVGTALQSPYITAPQNLSRRVGTSPKE